MGVTILPSTISGGLTPICNDCGVTLCWDVSDQDYAAAKYFWDLWICQDCNGGLPLSLREWRESMASLAIFACNKCGARVGCADAEFHGRTKPFLIHCLCEGDSKPIVMDRVRGVDPQKPQQGQTGLVLLVDGNNYIHTFWAANPEGNRLTAAQGMVDCLNAFKNRYKAIRVIVVFDGEGKTFRHEAYELYKKGREPKDPGLEEQFALAKKLSEDAGFFVVQIPNYEADDVLATLALRSKNRGNKVVIFSRDKDMRQLLDGEGITLLIKSSRVHGAYDWTFYTLKDFEELYPFKPDRFADFLALSGDGTDGWPGVEGIGVKNGTELIKEFGGLDEIVAAAKAASEKIPTRFHEKLSKFNVELGRKMIRLKTDVPIPRPKPETKNEPQGNDSANA